MEINHSISQAKKNENDYQYYKDCINSLLAQASGNTFMQDVGTLGISRKIKLQGNYDLLNGIVNKQDFAHVFNTYNIDVSNMPVNFEHKDIVSPLFKLLFGMEMNRPFEWSVVATDEDATTRFEEEYYNKLKQSVTDTLIQEVRIKIEAENPTNGLSPEKAQKIREKIEQEVQAQTPESVEHYMQRDYKDIAEVMCEQLLKYFMKFDDLENKFLKNWKHVVIAGFEVYWVGIMNGTPTVRVVNPLHTTVITSNDSQYVEDADAVYVEYFLTPSQIVEIFGEVLNSEEINKLYDSSYSSAALMNWELGYNIQPRGTIKVVHAEWQALRKIGIVTQEDGTEVIVDEKYKINKELGDVSIEWRYIPETHETYKIGTDMYKYTRPVRNQHKDLENLYKRKLASFRGFIYDNLNSEVIAIADRVKPYAYLYDVIMFRIEQLMASDKGKKLAININAIPKSTGFNLEKFMYFMDNSPNIFVNPNQNEMKGASTEIGSIAKEIDLSLASDIGRYIQFLEYIEKKAGSVVGINEQMLGSIKASETVTNVKQALNQSSYVLEPYFQDHATVKRNVLQALIEQAKIAYRGVKSKKLQFALDDLSLQYLNIDGDLLDNSTLGIYIANSAKSAELKELAKQLSHAALQNQMIEFADILRIYRSDSSKQTEELMQVAEGRKQKQAMQLKEQEQQFEIKKQAMIEESKDRDVERQSKLIVLKEAERRETEIQKQTILSLGFNEDKDLNNNGKPDVIELMNYALDKEKLDFEKVKFDKQQELEKEKLKKSTK